MALRTFRSNPSLGGFGSGEADGDAFCQSIKELVDNAVDACAVGDGMDGSGPVATSTTPKRVRVVIEEFGDDTSSANTELLRLTVSDNGIGMKDVQACVDPFSTSKAHNTGATTVEQASAGRYGIGLTLCLLHAQRLVPNSCARITSATREQSLWTQVTCVVDTDSVKCIRRDNLPKANDGESGTSICILVPGGDIAKKAWPRMAEYFARFRLSLGLSCSLEVLAPCLSKSPLYVRPMKETPLQSSRAKSTESNALPSRKNKPGESIREQQEICKAVEHYLDRPVELRNVAHAVVPIRFPNDTNFQPPTATHATRHRKTGQPSQNHRTLEPRPRVEVYLVVHGVGKDDDKDDCRHDNIFDVSDNDTSDDGRESEDGGTMTLVRMVNRIPLLDSTEGLACGFVRGVASKKSLWTSFGLNVTLRHDDNDAKIPTFAVLDSDQVAPFFQRGTHGLLAGDEDSNDVHVSAEESDSDSVPRKRKRCGQHQKERQILPATARLAHILCVLQIHAKPKELPLPTLSKGRLPLEYDPIDKSLEAALTQCLRQLQKSNPSLLFTPSELRVVERDFRYVPAVASSVASVLRNFSNVSKQRMLLNVVSKWGESKALTEAVDLLDSGDEDQSSEGVSVQQRPEPGFSKHELDTLIEGRLCSALAAAAQDKRKGSRPRQVPDCEKPPSSVDQVELTTLHSFKDLLQEDNQDSDDLDSQNKAADDKTLQANCDASVSASEEGYEDWLL